MYRWILVPVLALAASPSQAQTPGAARESLQAKAEAGFQQADTNHDGRLSLAEMQNEQNARLAERFARLDGNHDGGVSLDEMRQGHRQRIQDRRAGRAERHATRLRLRALDSNQDHALSRAELGDRMPKLSQNFDRIDLDHDGRITREELRQARQLLRAERQAH